MQEHAGGARHAVVDALGHRVPGLVVLHVAVVAVVRAVAHAPAVVGHQDGRVHHVPNKVVERLVAGEALVTAAHARRAGSGAQDTARARGRSAGDTQAAGQTPDRSRCLPARAHARAVKRGRRTSRGRPRRAPRTSCPAPASTAATAPWPARGAPQHAARGSGAGAGAMQAHARPGYQSAAAPQPAAAC